MQITLEDGTLKFEGLNHQEELRLDIEPNGIGEPRYLYITATMDGEEFEGRLHPKGNEPVQVELTPNIKELISGILEYLYDERKDWAAAGRPSNHIWLQVEAVRLWLQQT